MSRLTKIVLGAGAFLVMSGGLLALTGWATGADTEALEYNFFRSGSNVEHAVPDLPVDEVVPDGQGYLEDLDVGTFHKLDLDIAFGDVTVMEGDAYGVSLNWNGNQYWMHYELEGDTLKVRSSGSKNLSLDTNEAWVYIYLPAGAELEELDISTKMGELILYDTNVQEADITSSLGDVSLYDMTAGDLDVECSLGDIWMDNVTADTLKVTDSMGEINGTDVNVTQSLKAEDTMGNISFYGDLRGELDIEASMGNVSVTLKEDIGQYGYDLKVNMGEITVDAESFHKSASRTGGPHSLEIEDHMGDIGVYFNG